MFCKISLVEVIRSFVTKWRQPGVRECQTAVQSLGFEFSVRGHLHNTFVIVNTFRP